MNEKEFEELFHTKYNSFCNYANTIIKDEAAAEDIIQEIFIDFWKRHGNKELTFKAENYIVRAIKYKCIDFIRKQAVHKNYVNENLQLSPGIGEEDPLHPSDVDIKLVLDLAINELPAKTKEVFILSKISRLSYKEIALKLGISEKTVENQMARAFKHLRIKLKDYKFFQVMLFFFLSGRGF